MNNHNNIIYFKTHNNKSLTSDFDDYVSHKRVFFNSEPHFFNSIDNPWIFLAVKPHLITSVIKENLELIKAVKPKALISVVAGIEIKTLRSIVPHEIPIIRTMPNISVASGSGLIGYLSSPNIIIDDFIDLCKSLGMLCPLNTEEEFHLFTSLAGSGPAFILHFIESMTEAAFKLGMDYEQAEKISIQVFMGVATLLSNGNQQGLPRQLRESVTSPNGTTQAGLEVLINSELDVKNSYLLALIYKTLEASRKKSQNIT